MITTIRADMTWEGKTAKALCNQSEKKLKTFLKQLTEASDVDIIEANSWDEEGDDGWDE